MLTIVKTTFIMLITFSILNVITFDMFHIKCLARFITLFYIYVKMHFIRYR